MSPERSVGAPSLALEDLPHGSPRVALGRRVSLGRRKVRPLVLRQCPSRSCSRCAPRLPPTCAPRRSPCSVIARLVLWLLLIDLVDVVLSFAFEVRSLLPALTRSVSSFVAPAALSLESSFVELCVYCLAFAFGLSFAFAAGCFPEVVDVHVVVFLLWVARQLQGDVVDDLPLHLCIRAVPVGVQLQVRGQLTRVESSSLRWPSLSLHSAWPRPSCPHAY